MVIDMSEKNPLAVLWIGRATIYEYQDVTDPTTVQTTQKLVPVVTNERCRVSYSGSRYGEGVVVVAGGVPNTEEKILLFIRPELDIKPGSVIEVTQRGITTKYKGSSQTPKYTYHQEVTLELYEEHA